MHFDLLPPRPPPCLLQTPLGDQVYKQIPFCLTPEPYEPYSQYYPLQRSVMHQVLTPIVSLLYLRLNF